MTNDELERALSRCTLRTDAGLQTDATTIEILSKELARLSDEGGWIELSAGTNPVRRFSVVRDDGWSLSRDGGVAERTERAAIVPSLASWVDEARTVPAAAVPPGDARVATGSFALTLPGLAGLVLAGCFFATWFTVFGFLSLSGWSFLRLAFEDADGAQKAEALLVLLIPLAGGAVVVAEALRRPSRALRLAAGLVAPVLLVYAIARSGEWDFVKLLDIGATMGLAASVLLILSALVPEDFGDRPSLPHVGAAVLLLGAAAVAWPLTQNDASARDFFGGSSAATEADVDLSDLEEQFENELEEFDELDSGTVRNDSGYDSWDDCYEADDTSYVDCEGLPGDPDPAPPSEHSDFDECILDEGNGMAFEDCVSEYGRSRG